MDGLTVVDVDVAVVADVVDDVEVLSLLLLLLISVAVLVEVVLLLSLSIHGLHKIGSGGRSSYAQKTNKQTARSTSLHPLPDRKAHFPSTAQKMGQMIAGQTSEGSISPLGQ